MNSDLITKPNIEIFGSISYPNAFKWSRIVVFQTFVSMIYTYGLMSTYFTRQQINPGHSAFLSLNLFLCMILTGQLTGGHTNPIITLSLMFGKGKQNITMIQGLIYILSQFVGSIIGGAIGYGVLDIFSAPIISSKYTIGQAFGGQVAGTFLFCLWLLIMSNQRTTFAKQNFTNYLLLPVAFYIAREVSDQINGLNPAAVLANQVFYGIRYNDIQLLGSYWVYLIGPLLGCFGGVLFFNYMYFPMYIRWISKK